MNSGFNISAWNFYIGTLRNMSADNFKTGVYGRVHQNCYLQIKMKQNNQCTAKNICTASKL